MFQDKCLSVSSLLADNPKKSPRYEIGGFSDPRAIRALLALMDMEAVHSGAACHWGGPSALAELVSAAYGLIFSEPQWKERFHVINDIGHAQNVFYALWANYEFCNLNLETLRGFRSMGSPLTGHGEAHLFPEGVYLSNGPLGSTLAQAQGLCFADNLKKKKRTCLAFISDGALMEGEAKEALAAIPGFFQQNKMAPFVLVISDNEKKLSASIGEDSFSMQPTLSSLEALGWDVCVLEEAHSLKACIQTFKNLFEKAKTSQKPLALIAKTVKGYGVKSTSSDKSGGHGFPLKKPEELHAFLEEIYQGDNVPEEFLNLVKTLEKKPAPKLPEKLSGDYEKIQKGISRALIEKSEKNYPIFNISSDLYGSTGLGDFRKKFPTQAQDVGVSESNMISMAAGLSKQGFIPVVDTFAQFGTTKGALPLLMASLSQAPMISIFSHTGFQDAADGASHQSLNYFSITSGLPFTKVFTLSCSEEAYQLLSQALDEFYEARKQGKVPCHYVFFLGRENFPSQYKGVQDYKLGSASVFCDVTEPDVVIASFGSLVPEAILAHKKLKQKNIKALVVHPSSANEVDFETMTALIQKTPRLITVEDHQVKSGMGQFLTSSLQDKGLEFRSLCLGVRGTFGQSSYTAHELYKKHGLDSDSLVSQVEEFLKS